MLRIVDGLRLKKLRARLHLHFELRQHRADKVAFRRHCRADGEVGGSVQLVAGIIAAAVQGLYEAHHLNGVEIIDRFGVLMAAHCWIVARQAKDITDSKHVGAHQIGLHRDPVPITAGQLHDGIMSHLVQQSTDR